MATQLVTADSRNKFEDLSGVDIAAYANPYDALIEACEDNSVSFVLLNYFSSHQIFRSKSKLSRDT
jgi:hypothetical protein